MTATAAQHLLQPTQQRLIHYVNRYTSWRADSPTQCYLACRPATWA